QLNASGSSDPDGTVTSYRFDFGDSTAAGPQTSAVAHHTYAAGHWTATVTVTDDKGATATATDTVTVNAPAANQPPVAKLTATPPSGTAPLAVQLNASGSSDPDGTVTSYRFDFGDSTAAGPQTSAVANHTYAAGHWTATVTVTDDKGATATATDTVTVNAPAPNRPPVAVLDIRPASGTAPLNVHASSSGSSDPEGHIVSYLFDFGDGTRVGPQHSPQAQHTYAAGHWTARVDVTDDGGATASALATVDVSGPPSNLVANGSFEGGTSGWSAMGGASLRRVQGGKDGRFSLPVSAPRLGLVSYGASDQPSALPAGEAVGAQYHARAWVRSELGAGLVSLAVRESNASGASFTTLSSSVVLGTGWLALDADVTTHLLGSMLGVSVVNAPSVLGTAFRVDDVSIVTGSGVAMPAEFADDAPEPGAVDDPFLAPGVHPNPVRADGARIVFATSAAGATQIAIYDLAGRVVRRLGGDPAAAAGAQSVAFDGRGDDGRRLRGGVYYYQVRTPGAATHGRLVIAE
ncbi:MAG TPA: PKD domain-containing protein, partial [Verrucomicrobiae bacterium]|nr:PKD domain-containing protein [Verrucomicrobiae bacterium]